MYVDEGASYSDWNNLGKAMQRLIPFNTGTYAYLAERRSEGQVGHVKQYCVGQCRQYVDASTKQTTECMGEGLAA